MTMENDRRVKRQPEDRTAEQRFNFLKPPDCGLGHLRGPAALSNEFHFRKEVSHFE
jgi:hypothetical protein